MTIPSQAVQVESPTERRNPDTTDLDLLPTEDLLRAINREDHRAPRAVAAALADLAAAVDLAADALGAGHRVHYVGAGTSGRLATLDAAELAPTFNAPADWFVVHHAGGAQAFTAAVEGAEDDFEGGASELRASAAPGDFVLGLAASGRTPYVLGALDAAARLGARTGFVSCNPLARRPEVDVAITLDTGPEALAGSTRMKAGTAQKMVLTSFSTAVMVRLGRTYSNLMVSMRATNAKLRGRTERILQEASGASAAECAEALADSDGDLKAALVRLLSGAGPEEAVRALAAHRGHVRHALDSLLHPQACS